MDTDEPEVAFERDVVASSGDGAMGPAEVAAVFLVAAFFFVVEAVVFLVAAFLALVFLALFTSWGLDVMSASPLGGLSLVGLLGALLSLAGAFAAGLLGAALALSMGAFFSAASAALRARSRSARAAFLAWRRRTR